MSNPQQIEQALESLEANRTILGDSSVDTAQEALRSWLQSLTKQPKFLSGAAQTILEEAYTVLHQRAEQISNPKLRRRFLQNVSVNRQIEQAWRRMHQPD